MRERGWTPAIEDYVKAIWLIEERGDDATGQAVAAHLEISQASVTSMFKKLHELGLVVHAPYRPVQLTEHGRLVALEVVRHHRLLELFLAEALGMGWDRIHAEAEVLEHHISEELEELIAAKLGHPEFDPHGHPIPRRDGQMPVLVGTPLAVLADSTRGIVRQVRDETPEVLRFLAERGVVVGATIHIAEQLPLAGITTIQVEGAPVPCTLGRDLSERIDVEVAE